ncbi:MAG: organoarsenical effux MFS transporter ArsJ, partial [Mangrovicoccus sp.]
MLTDGALRMLVLLHFETLGFSPVQLAFMFLLYEFMGMVTNLTAGWLAARFGLTVTLYAGLVLQIGALLALAQLNPAWALWASVAFVMVVQGCAGVAKDLTKMSSKSAVKLLAPKEEKGALFKWVAALTGSKNAVKGLGFLLGAALLALLGFTGATLSMAVALAVVLSLVFSFMPRGLPTGRKSAKFQEVFSKDRNINILSAARVFLFGARDAWFVVGIPAYFYQVLSDGTVPGMRMAFFMIGAFMALWLVGYGAVQAYAPKFLKAKDKELKDVVQLARRWAGILVTVPVALTIAALLAGGPVGWLTAVLVVGLLIFGAIFAVNSSVHSYLVLAFTKDDRAAMDVGFYYMS